jgi:DNA-binding NarL/FixJ family response regulator
MILEDAKDIEIKGVTDNGLSLLNMLEREAVDLVLLDLEMPKMNGMEACKQIKRQFPQVKIVVLSMLQEVSIIKSLIHGGADGYVLKNAAHGEILMAIREVYQGEQYLSKKITQLLINNITKDASTSSTVIFPALSRREKEVLQLILDEQTSKEIADTLSLSRDTVETHRKRLLSKLNVRNTAGLVRVTVEHNLLNKS